MRHKEPNPLNVFDVRQCVFAPPHFEYMNIPMTYNLEQSIVKWVDKNLKHRFYVGKNVSLDTKNKLTNVLTVGFEEPKEMSYFTLACPHLKYK